MPAFGNNEDPEPSPILFEAVEQEFLRQEDIVGLADGVILAMDKPPAWAVEMSGGVPATGTILRASFRWPELLLLTAAATSPGTPIF